MRASCLAFCNECCKEGSLEQESLRDKQVGSKRPATASGCGGAGPSAASALLSDAPRHRPRRASLHPAPRRSQRRLTPFFRSLLHMKPVRLVFFAVALAGLLLLPRYVSSYKLLTYTNVLCLALMAQGWNFI